MSSEAAMDISNAEIQDQIADSLMDPAGASPMPDGWAHSEVREAEEPSESVEESIASLETDREDWQDSPREEASQSEREQQSVAQQPPAEITPQELTASLERTDAFLAERQLVDASESRELASELGLDPAQAAVAGQALGRLGISAISIMDQAGWDLGNVRPLHPAQLNAVHDEVCKLIGIADPRLSPVAHREQFGAHVLFGVANFLSTVSRYGTNASLSQLNDPRQAESFVNQLRAHFGENAPVDRATALKTVDALTRPLLSMVRKLDAQRQAAGPQRRVSAPSSRQRTQVQGHRTTVPRMRTNNDLFDAGTLAAYQRDHGKL